MRRLFTFIISVLLLSTLLTATVSAATWSGNMPSPTVAATFSGGNGTEASPYQIATPADLAQLAANVNDGIDYYGMYFCLTADIQLNDVSNFKNWGEQAPANEWTPIGASASTPFRGSFDGKSHTVSGLYLSTYLPYCGLFGYVSAGSITDLHLTNTYIDGGDYVGAVVGYMTEAVYFADSKAVLSSCSADGYIHGSRYVGGIVGYTNVDVVNCVSNADASAERFAAGGVVGVNEGATVSRCSSNASVTGPTALSGGIVGKNTGTVERCWNFSQVYAVSSAGGIAGYNGGTVRDCFNAGPVGVSGGVIAGGIVGENDGTLATCYNIGAVRGETDVYAVVGKRTSGTVTNCYYLSMYDAKDRTGCQGLSRTQMKMSAAYTGFDFSRTWALTSGRYPYPHLREDPFTFYCSHTSTVTVETAATCEKDGEIKTVCTVCDTVTATETVRGGHEYEYTATTLPTCTSAGYQTYTCTICRDSYTKPYGTMTPHELNPWVTTKVATCTEDGARYRTCKNCTYRVDETLTAITHHYEVESTTADCITDGFNINTCIFCGDTYRSDEATAFGHTPSDWLEITACSFTTDGEYQRECTVCGEILDQMTEPAYGFMALGGVILFLGLITLVLIFVCASLSRKKAHYAELLAAVGQKTPKAPAHNHEYYRSMHADSGEDFYDEDDEDEPYADTTDGLFYVNDTTDEDSSATDTSDDEDDDWI